MLAITRYLIQPVVLRCQSLPVVAHNKLGSGALDQVVTRTTIPHAKATPQNECDSFLESRHCYQHRATRLAKFQLNKTTHATTNERQKGRKRGSLDQRSPSKDGLVYFRSTTPPDPSPRCRQPALSSRPPLHQASSRCTPPAGFGATLLDRARRLCDGQDQQAGVGTGHGKGAGAERRSPYVSLY